MAFTQTTRVWWDTALPGAGTSELEDAKTATTPTAAEESGIEGRHSDRLFVCERSGFTVPFSETVIDPVSGNRVWQRFADELPPQDRDKPQMPMPPGDPWVP